MMYFIPQSFTALANLDIRLPAIPIAGLACIELVP